MFPHKRTVLLLLATAALAAEPKAERTDLHGDSLPQGAVARLGTVRGRLPGLAAACAFSHDGKNLVAAGGDKAIHVFDAATLRPLRLLHHHKKNVTCLAFSPDGKMLASGSDDGTLCLWDWPDGKVLRSFQAHTGGVRALAFAGTGKFLASGGQDKVVRLWDPTSGREIRQYKGHETDVTALAVSPDGRMVASSSIPRFSDTVHLWDAASDRLLHQPEQGGEWVQSLAFSPDGKLLALPVAHQRIGLCDTASGKMVRRLSAKLRSTFSAVAFSPAGRSVAAAATDGSLVLWDTTTGKIVHQRPGSPIVRVPGGITCLAFSPDGRRLAIGEEQCLRTWDPGAWREIHPVEGHADPISRVLFSRDDKTVVTAADQLGDALQEWDAATGKKRRTLWQQELIGMHTFHLSPDHAELTILETEEKELVLRCWNTSTEKEIRRLKMPFNVGEYNPATMGLSPDGKIVTSEWREEHGHPQPILLRDTTSGKEIGKVSGRHGWFLFSPDSSTLAFVQTGQLVLHNVARDRIVWQRPLVANTNYGRNLAFSVNGRLVSVVSRTSDESDASRIDFWETTTGQKRAAYAISVFFLGLAFSPDGALLAGGDSDGIIHLWGLAAGKELRQLRRHRGRVDSLAFSHDGKWLASGSSDTTALIWDVRETAEAARPRPIDVSRQRLERLWADLSGNDGERAQRAIWELVAARQTMPWLREHLKPVSPADARRIARLIADLDSDDFAVREKATQELEAMGQATGPALRKALASKPSLEMRRRVELIVNKLDNWPASSAAALRAWRALEVLEHLGTPEARQLLERMAEGDAEARMTREAKAALRRLAPRPAPMP